MPYLRNTDLPPGVKSVLPQGAQTIWRRVFNQTEADGDSETSSIRQAWGAIKDAGYRKVEGQRLYQLRKAI